MDNVSFGFDGRAVMRDLTLRAKPGEFLAIVGPNGCGKSTALKLIAGLHRPASGVVRIDGQDIAAMGRARIARHVALLTQASAVPPNMTVHELIAMGRFAHQGFLSRRSARDEEAIAHAMRVMDVTGLSHRRVGELSGGQLQRCRMAMTLAQDCGILLLDEPTTYLDLRYQFDILETARAQARAGAAVVAVLHDFTQASLYADRVAVMHEGRIAASGPASEVLTEDVIARVFGVRTRAVNAHGGIFHIPEGAVR